MIGEFSNRWGKLSCTITVGEGSSRLRHSCRVSRFLSNKKNKKDFQVEIKKKMAIRFRLHRKRGCAFICTVLSPIDS